MPGNQCGADERSPQNKAVLEEYRTLREELLLHMKWGRQIVAASGPLFFIAVGGFLQFESSEATVVLGLVLLLVLVPLFLIYRAEVFSIARIASYIEKCIEPSVDGLRWTRANAASRIEHPKSKVRKFASRVMAPPTLRGGVILYFAIMVALAWWLPVHLLGHWYPGIVTVAMAALTAIFLWNCVLLALYRIRRRAWEEAWKVDLQRERIEPM